MNTIATPVQLTRDVYMRKCGLDDFQYLIDFIDTWLRKDWHLPPVQFKQILTRPASEVWAICRQHALIGFAIMYGGSTLHNLFIAPHERGSGIGMAVINRLQPRMIRAKRNMSTGDPVPFYEKNGFKTRYHVKERPHIAIMTPKTRKEK